MRVVSRVALTPGSPVLFFLSVSIEKQFAVTVVALCVVSPDIVIRVFAQRPTFPT